ncbi:MAG: Dabb family protein [Acidobacteriota bacterium]|nr:Dabb family protein [Acidobacteriota bacterium]
MLFRPKAGLANADRARLLDALRDAHDQIPHIRRFIVGTRMTIGTPYEAGARDFPYFVQLEFQSREDLGAYLTHPAHQQLALGFYEMSDAAEAYDFEIEAMPEGADALGVVGEN